MLKLRLGLDDLRAAYRRVPSREKNFCAIVIYLVKHQDWRYFVPFGHNFGFQSAVSNFNRVSEAMSVFARVFGTSCCDHFFNNNMDVSSKERDITKTPNNNNHVSSSQWFLYEIHSLVGVRLEPKKNASMHTAQTWHWASMLIFPQRRPAGASSSSLQVAGQSSFLKPSRRPRRITTSPRAWQPPSLIRCMSCSSPGLTSAAVEQRRSLWCSVHHSYQHREPPEKVLFLLVQAPWS